MRLGNGADYSILLAVTAAGVAVWVLLRRSKQARLDVAQMSTLVKTIEELEKELANHQQVQNARSPVPSVEEESSSIAPCTPIRRGPATASMQAALADPFKSRTMLSAKHVTVGRKLGAGSFGAVYQGWWRGVDCALKFLSSEAAADLLHECDILDALEHPNVLRLFGVCVGEAPASWPADLSPPAICCELLSNGTFLDFLLAVPVHRRNEETHWSMIAEMLLGVARGLGYLHSLTIIHRDLKAANLMLDGQMNLKICDFGLATAHDRWIRTQTASIGTYSHMAPEVMLALAPGSARYTHSADIFSFGIVISEALAGDEAGQIIDATRTKNFGLSECGMRRLLPSPLPVQAAQLLKLAIECCTLDPEMRPSAFSLINALEAIDSDTRREHSRAGSEVDYLRHRRNQMISFARAAEFAANRRMRRLSQLGVEYESGKDLLHGAAPPLSRSPPVHRSESDVKAWASAVEKAWEKEIASARERMITSTEYDDERVSRRASSTQGSHACASTGLSGSGEAGGAARWDGTLGPRSPVMRASPLEKAALDERGANVVKDSRFRRVSSSELQAIIGAVDLTLSEVRLHYFGLGKEHAIALAECLVANKCLRHVDLGSNPLRDAGVVAVCDALRGCNTLELLFVHDVMMTSRGALSIATLLRRLPALGSLNLGSNLLGVRGLRAICEAVTDQNMLEELYLYDVNHRGDESSEGIEIIVQMIESSTSLRWLDLSDNMLCGFDWRGRGSPNLRLLARLGHAVGSSNLAWLGLIGNGIDLHDECANVFWGAFESHEREEEVELCFHLSESQMCALLARQAAYARGGRAGEPSREVSPCREMSVHRVREQLSQLLGSTLHECESGRSRCPQQPTLIECENQPTRKLLLCGVEFAETNLQQLALMAEAPQDGVDQGVRVEAHVNCMGKAAVESCWKEYKRAKLLPHVLALDAKDEEGYPLIKEHLSPFLQFLKTVPEGTVLVHCVEGRNRSAALVVAWLIVEGRMPLTQAVQLVVERRPNVLTNWSFREQLICLAREQHLLS